MADLIDPRDMRPGDSNAISDLLGLGRITVTDALRHLKQVEGIREAGSFEELKDRLAEFLLSFSPAAQEISRLVRLEDGTIARPDGEGPRLRR
jgi:hypothetical protein